ncbi:hypothetical protein NC651_033074 [Populus alba x Populus x berolinensis]|nr:hypothetical protein NC651_033074 [Populus alba x Populus x berolinensis]
MGIKCIHTHQLHGEPQPTCHRCCCNPTLGLAPSSLQTPTCHLFLSFGDMRSMAVEDHP